MNVFSCLLNSVQLTSLSRRLAGDTWSSCSKTSVTKTTVNTSDRALSPRRGPEGASRTFWGKINIVSQIARYFAWQHLVYKAGRLEFNSSSDRQPMKLTQYRCDVFATFGSCDQPCRSILQLMAWRWTTCSSEIVFGISGCAGVMGHAEGTNFLPLVT